MDKNQLFLEQIFDTKNKIGECIEWLKGKRVVLYGAGYCGYETATLLQSCGIEIVAVCDDDEKRIGAFLCGIKVGKIEDIVMEKDEIILITSGFNKAMKNRLCDLGLLPQYLAMDFGRYEPACETWQYFYHNGTEVNEAYRLLADEKSKQLFLNLINYRISRDLQYLQDCEESGKQYFPQEKFFSLGKQEVFLDLGAFDGDTIRDFLEYVGYQYDKVIALEVNSFNYQKLLSNVKGLENIVCYQKGAYSANTKLNFVISDAKNSFADKNGVETMEVVAIDTFLAQEKITFIKMDIEGAEYDAIRGAEKTIALHTPTLAISVYHKTADLFRIITYIHKINPNYTYYLRHYSPTVIETILYAVPNK